MSVHEERVRFFSDGVELSAVLVTDDAVDDAAAPRPAMIYTHGWSGAVNDRVLPLMRLLAADGYVGLAVDHRGFAESDGVRARCDPHEQARDVSNAATFLLQRPDVDPSRLLVLGASFGGAIAIAAAARDDRLRGVVSMVPMGNGARWLRELNGDERWAGLMARVEADAVARVTTGVGERVPFGTLLPGPNSHEEPSGDDPIARMYPTGFPLENLELALDFRPEDLVGSIAPRPVVLIGCDDDSIIPVSETLHIFERASDPKRLVRFETGNHLGPLGPRVEETAEAVRELVRGL